MFEPALTRSFRNIKVKFDLPLTRNPTFSCNPIRNLTNQIANGHHTQAGLYKKSTYLPQIHRESLVQTHNFNQQNRKYSAMSIPETHKAIRFHETGESYDVLKYESVPTPTPTSSEILIKNKYAGVNFIEKYFRIGLYPAKLPYTLGREAVGEIVSVGSEVEGYQVGDLIAYASASTFSEYTIINPSENFRILNIPKNATDEQLQLYAAVFIQGFTALTFIEEAYAVKKGDYILVHAAAGGVGSLLTQLITRLGAHVIATASTPEKLALAKSNGAEFLINSVSEDITAKVLEYTSGKGVQASFDSVGKDTWDISFNSTARKGTIVSFGNASGAVPPISINILSGKNLKVLRPTVFNYIGTKEEWEYYSQKMLKLISSGELKFDISKIYKLEDYPKAAADLEGRKTTGKLLLSI
ncbi:hypothetical protein WICPIJ_007484 [Wickerhamomyces pijperi]|uniref:Probable quinone oxidoreductase n=1 Tax=Wickerhamomyces pijperi TaxID=599730 RepID=A0A9P8PZU6_WICPI|nr:hypothetical protein WICPIJ_007484 [Wickerhamomyces pijperi]